MQRSHRALVGLILASLWLGACGPARIPLPRPKPVAPEDAGAPEPSGQAVIPRVYNDKVFTGLGTWLDIFEKGYRHPLRTVKRADAYGVSTLYVQTSNFTRPAIRFPGRYGAFIDAAHDRGLSVVAWYLPGLKDVPADLHKSLAAIDYTSATGQHADGFGLDIEAAEVRSHKARSTRVLLLSRQIRAAVGDSYPLGAITPMPLRLIETVTYWRDFPYAGLADYYDAILPMNYFTYEVSGGPAAQRYTAKGIDVIKAATGDPSFPVHNIGGIAGGAMSPTETAGFVRGVAQGGAIGMSLYNFSLTTAKQWGILRGELHAPATD